VSLARRRHLSTNPEPMLPGPNPIASAALTAEERLAEIAEILAAGLMRMRMLKSTCLSADPRESSLDCLALPSGHAGELLSTEPTP
jgi:hypothetical protein